MKGPRLRELLQHAWVRPDHTKYCALIFAAGWTIIAALSFLWSYHQHREEILEAARAEARTAYHKDVSFRLWNAKHGGVYVPVSEANQPSYFLSHLPERDVVTPSGRRLTLINPAYMTRAADELGRERYGIIGHLTSLKPLNPANTPDPWEVEALELFEKGEDEASSLQDIMGVRHMRLMRPLLIEESCLKCHEAQGYKIGDIRGGLSVAVPLQPLLEAMGHHVAYNWLGQGLMWTMGLTIIGFGARSLLIKGDKIRESESRYRQLFHSGQDAVFVHGLTDDFMPGRFIEVNDIARQRLGYSKEEFLGLSPKDIDPGYPIDLQEMVEKLRSRGDLLYESFLVTKGGEKFHVEVNAHLFEISGRPAVLSIARDISERRKMQDLIVQAKEEWEETFNTINDAITIHDRDFNVVRANKAAEAMLGIPLETLSGHKCYQCYHGSDGPPSICPSSLVLKTGRPSSVEVYEPYLGKFLEIKSLPRLDQEGGIAGIVHIVRDITERRRAEEEQKKLQSQLIQAQKMESIGRLAGGIAHDFNNLLSVIIGYSDLALLTLADDMPSKEQVRIIREAGEKARALTGQLLAFSRKQELSMMPVDLNTVIAKMSTMLERLIGKDITLEVNMKASQALIMADPSRLEQVLMNLAVNARDSMPAGGSIRIETDLVELDQEYTDMREGMSPGTHVMLSVTDTGLGMTREVQERLFEPFFTTKEEGKGTGLGLAVVYGIITQHKGYITVKSEPGKGTSFRILLPAVS